MHRLVLLPVIASLPLATLVATASAQTAPEGTPAPSGSSTEPPAPMPTLPPATTTAPPTPPPAPTAAATTTVVAPIPAPAELADVTPKKDEPTDHDLVVGHLGIAYFGQFDVPIGFTRARPAGSTVPVQRVGVKYWVTARFRLDVAFGIDVESGSDDVNSGNSSTSVDQPSTLAVAFRLGLPIALFSGKHYTFYLGPEFDYGHAGETVHGTPTPTGSGSSFTPADTTHQGNRTAFGARAGAEIQFGFLGIPHLALDATVGLLAELTNGNTSGPLSTGGPGPSVDETFHHLSIQSTVGHQPWNIFITNVEASYYF